MSSAPRMRCEQLVIGYGGKGILPPISFELAPAEIVLVVGSNGSGKTTWLKTVLGLIPPVAGSVRFAADAVPAYVPQEAAIDPMVPVTPLDVAGWGRLRGWNFLNPILELQQRAAVVRALVSAGARSFVREPFSELSGGQKQRTLFARMLASGANTAFLDEPTAAMDYSAARDAFSRLAALSRDKGMSLLVVSHTLGLAAEFADRAIYFERSGPHAGVHTGTVAEIFTHAEFRSTFGEVPH